MLQYQHHHHQQQLLFPGTLDFHDNIDQVAHLHLEKKQLEAKQNLKAYALHMENYFHFNFKDNELLMSPQG